MGHLGVVLFEYLGEEYPEVLGSILGALKSICNVIGMTKMQPPIKDLLPRLTPILKNRHEKVQENCIDLVGRIADRGAEHVSAREWMRICFELLEQLKLAAGLAELRLLRHALALQLFALGDRALVLLAELLLVPQQARALALRLLHLLPVSSSPPAALSRPRMGPTADSLAQAQTPPQSRE